MPENEVLPVNWRKARRSMSNGACVEVASGRANVVVRDSVDPAGPRIQYPEHAWRSFIADAKQDS